MSNFVIDLRDEPERADAVKGRGGTRRSVLIIGASVVALVLIGVVAGYLYWLSLRTTPQYSLALIIDASRRSDQATTDNLVDIDAVVDDFIPQITAKAVELYGRGMPPETIQKVANVARPLMPALKDRARTELPKVIRERTEKFQSIPFFVLVLGAGRYLDITENGDTAEIKSKVADRPFQIKMTRSGNRWKISGVTDEQLATMIAQKVGQEIVAFASKGSSGSGLGIQNLADILRQAEHIFDER